MNTLSGLIMFGLILVVMLAMMLPLMARAVTFIPPVECEIGKDCFIQNYTDIDTSAGAKDYRCGALSYDGHKGTDFRLRDLVAMQKGVNVLSAAKGKVKAVRDGMRDVMVSRDDTSTIAGRECGNGIVIEHNSGFETQYCHLMEKSITVREGQEVERGVVLGKIGLSGNTEFPHLHFSVRQDDVVIDPFIGPADDVTCASVGKNLWHNNYRDKLAYQNGVLLNLHFSLDAPKAASAREGQHRVTTLTAESEALVLWSDTMALESGDSVSLRILKPDGNVFADHSVTVERSKAQQFLFAGKKRPKGGWEEGIYSGSYTLVRDGRVIDTKGISIRLD